MAYFAKIDSNYKVLEVIVASTSEGLEGTWLEASDDGSIRKNFPGIGYSYSIELDAFIAPKPYASWLLNTETCKWEAPKPYPSDGLWYEWHEDILDWVLVAGS